MQHFLSFELYGNLLISHWNGDVFNQSFVISPRVCFTCQQQNLTTLALGEKILQFRSNFMGDQIRGWITLHRYQTSCQSISLISTYTHLQRHQNCHSTTTSGRSYDFLFTTRCCACGDKQPWSLNLDTSINANGGFCQKSLTLVLLNPEISCLSKTV